MRFTIGEVGYNCKVSKRTATVTREDGRHETFRDSKNDIQDWEPALIDVIAGNDTLFGDD